MRANPLVLIIAAILYIASGAPARADEPAASRAAATVALWPKGQMPGRGATGPERELPARGDNVIRLTDINEPMITVFKVPTTSKPAPAVIICPGGAYGILAYNKEGTEIAGWLNSIGITGIVLKYRVPGNLEGAYQDIQRAVRLVRRNASDWNISTKRVGVMGFSAGGHLCARLSTNADKSTYPKLDVVDEEKLRPDFAILVYPAYLSRGADKLAADLPVNDKTPPTFLVHAEDDKSFVAGSRIYHVALEAANVPTEFFLCATGGHGHGLRSDKEVKVWPKKCQEWLIKAGIL
jgi:acetyl esterase/lipase